MPRQTTTAEAVVQRVALVIGNGSYQHLDRLANPANDARAVAAALWNLGFEVIEVIDADLGQTLAAMTTFARRLRPGMEALFYYAGHAVQWNGANFLLPTSARVGSNADLLHQAIDAGAIVQVMEKAGARLNLLILDSCRDNPFPDGIAEGSSGLAEMRGQTAEMLIGYATAPGTVASDGEGRHSPYTAALLEHLEEPGLEVAMLFRRVRSSVRQATDGNQIPWVSSSLENEFYFRPAAQPAIQLAALGSSPTDTLGMLPPSVVVELAYWQSIKDSRDPGALGAFLERHPDGNFADLARRKLAQLSGREPAAAVLPPPDAPDEARTPDRTLGEVESFIGVGPIALPLDLPAGIDAGPAAGPPRSAARQRGADARRQRDPGQRRPAHRQHAGRAASSSRTSAAVARRTACATRCSTARARSPTATWSSPPACIPATSWAVIRTTRTGSRTGCGSSSSTRWPRSPPASGRSSSSPTCRASPRSSAAPTVPPATMRRR